MGAERGNATVSLEIVARGGDQRPDEAHELIGEDDDGNHDQAG